jgi:rfaE bifunctional protein kinase chain/domain
VESSIFSVEAILASLPHVQATVFGDFCLDAYWWLDAAEGELSLETGLPSRRVIRQQYTLGGAGNVVANLVDLGVKTVRAIGVVGSDLFGNELLSLLRQTGADITGMHVDGAWHTMVYAKPCHGHQEDQRLDFGTFNSLSSEVTSFLVSELHSAAASSDIVVLNQQRPTGISTPSLIEQLNQVIADYPKTRFIVDARHQARLYRGAILKLNAHEAQRLLAGASDDSSVTEQKARDYAFRLYQVTNKPVFLTRGDQGMIVAEDGLVHQVPGIQIIDQTDPVGAGDAAVAALAAVLGSSGDALGAARFANVAASITVRKLQTTGTATPEEIINAANECDYVYQPDLAADSRQARYFEDTEIEIVDVLPSGLKIKHAVFDHDGTVSTLRQGWEQIMEPVMVRAILGTQYETVDSSVYRRVQERVQEFIDKTTGVQTLVQMKGLAQMVAEFGFIPADQILNEHGYKRIFNEQLLAMVNGRVRKLERDELAAEDFQIKNARLLLEQLRSCGVELYLASGTDENDVRAEAEALGYADLFEGRIFGAVGDVNIEAKRIVLERIIQENNLAGHEFMTFGDGPVEIRETRKRGGVCIGVASDEVRRFGLSLTKRARLVRAGAQLIVPDFTQASALLSLLQLA